MGRFLGQAWPDAIGLDRPETACFGVPLLNKSNLLLYLKIGLRRPFVKRDLEEDWAEKPMLCAIWGAAVVFVATARLASGRPARVTLY